MLPKPYVSWSQYELWNRSRAAYQRKYFMGEEQYSTVYMNAGIDFATMVEKGEALTDIVPLESEKEYYGEVVIDGVKLMGKLDAYDGETIYEVKTGTKLWDKERAENHGQLLFYQLLVGKKPCKLIWEKTMGNDLTGGTFVFDFEHTQEQLDEFKDNVLEEISNISESYFNYIMGHDYDYLLWLSSEYKENKKQIKEYMEENKLYFFSNKYGKFSLSNKGRLTKTKPAGLI